MKALTSFPSILVCPQPVDFRKGRRSLSAFVQECLGCDPFAETLFVFTNRRRDTIKALYWDRTGFALWEKGLEEDCFAWPKPPFPERVVITPEQAQWLLDGIDIWKIKPHQTRTYSRVV